MPSTSCSSPTSVPTSLQAIQTCLRLEWRHELSLSNSMRTNSQAQSSLRVKRVRQRISCRRPQSSFHPQKLLASCPLTKDLARKQGLESRQSQVNFSDLARKIMQSNLQRRRHRTSFRSHQSSYSPTQRKYFRFCI